MFKRAWLLISFFCIWQSASCQNKCFIIYNLLSCHKCDNFSFINNIDSSLSAKIILTKYYENNSTIEVDKLIKDISYDKVIFSDSLFHCLNIHYETGLYILDSNNNEVFYLPLCSINPSEFIELINSYSNFGLKRKIVKIFENVSFGEIVRIFKNNDNSRIFLIDNYKSGSVYCYNYFIDKSLQLDYKIVVDSLLIKNVFAQSKLKRKFKTYDKFMLNLADMSKIPGLSAFKPKFLRVYNYFDKTYYLFEFSFVLKDKNLYTEYFILEYVNNNILNIYSIITKLNTFIDDNAFFIKNDKFYFSCYDRLSVSKKHFAKFTIRNNKLIQKEFLKDRLPEFCQNFQLSGKFVEENHLFFSNTPHFVGLQGFSNIKFQYFEKKFGNRKISDAIKDESKKLFISSLHLTSSTFEVLFHTNNSYYLGIFNKANNQIVRVIKLPIVIFNLSRGVLLDERTIIFLNSNDRTFELYFLE